ncbi:MAG: hypothetical protein DRH17_12310 [Deltaproteobacteria bacterium]|nr:MAG: hypothetical protein DRH17_12310 [Deltaproteobacteria bacterium]
MKRSSLFIIIILLLSSLTILNKQVSAAEYRLVVAMYYEPPPGGHLNFFVSGCAVSSSELWGLVVEQLAHYFCLNDTYKPWLATSWEIKGDEFIVHLRKGVTWSDGTSFTAKDVVCTFWILRLTNHILWNYIDDVKAIDDYTVSFHVKTPSYLIQYYVLTYPILPYSIYGEYSDKTMEYVKKGEIEKLPSLLANFTAFRPTKFIGTGPYVLASLTDSQQVYTKRPDYWATLQGIAKIYIDKVIVLRVTSDPQAAQLELASAVDYDECGGFVLGQIEEVPKRLNATFVIHPLFSGAAIFFNFKVYPLNLKEVRQAIAYALDLDKVASAGYPIHIIETRQTGFTTTTVKMFISEEVYKSLHDYSYNPEKAKKLLEGLGFKKGPDGVWVTPNGTRLEFEWTIPAGYATGRCGTLAAAMLTDFGIKINVRAVEPPTCYRKLVEGDFQILSWFWGGALPLPWFSAETWTYDYSPKITGYPGPSFPVVYEWEGKLVNVTKEALELNVGWDPLIHKSRVELLAKIFNEYLPFIQVCQKGNPLFINFERLEWPPLYEPDGSPSPWTYTYEGNLAWIIVHGLVVPKELLRLKALEEAAKAGEEAKTVAEMAKSAAEEARSAAEVARSAAEAAQASASQAITISSVSTVISIIALIIAIIGILRRRSPG